MPTIPDPDAILDSLLAYLTTKLPNRFKANGRKIVPLSKMGDGDFPALFLRHVADEDTYPGAQMVYARTEVEADLFIFTKLKNDKDASDSQLTPLVRDVRAAFAPDDISRGVFTLGGQAFWCRLEGRTDYYQGDLDQYANAVMTIKIMLP